MARRDSLLRSGISLIGGSLITGWRFDADFAARRNACLPVRHDAFARLDSLIDDDLIALTLAQCYLALIYGHVLLDDINVRSLRRHLRRSCRHQHRAVNRVQNETNVNEPSGPKSSIRIGNRRA